MIDWDAAKKTPILDIVDALDLGPVGTNHKVYCWNHPEDTPSVHIYEDTNSYFAFCCGKGGDVVNLVADVCGSSVGRAAGWILTSGIEPVDLPDRPSRKAPTDFTDRMYEETSVRFLETGKWLEENWPALKGYGPEVVARFDLRWTLQHMWIPHRWQAKIPGVKTRLWINGAKAALKGSQFRHLYRGYGKEHTRAVLCEGESDTWCMWAHTQGQNVDVVGLPSGVGNLTEELYEELGKYREVYLCLDWLKPDGSEDVAGMQATGELALQLDNAQSVSVPGGRVAESLADGWTPVF